MACTVAARSPLLRNPTVRRYAAAAAAQPAASSSASAPPELRVLDNKVTVAAVDTNSPIAQVSIVFRAGTRNETYDSQGTVHHLRIAAGLSTSRSSSFGITRNVQQLGGNLTATADRESIAYTLQITKNNLEPALTFLEDVATRQVFKPWEVSDQLPRLRYELSTIPETSRVLELLHKAAYRTGLGYSLYSPKRQLGRISTETLQHFVQSWFTGSRCAVVGTGVSLAELTCFASTLGVSSGGDCASEVARYHGGELRKERNSPLATVALAVEGAGCKNEKDALACAILQRALGTGPRVKWGECASPVHKDVAAAAAGEPFAISSLNATYTDSGLLGFVLCSPPNVAGALTKAAYKWLKSPKLSDADICRGKAVLKTEVLCAADNGTEMLESLQREALLKGKASQPDAIASEIDKVSTSEVTSVAGRIANGKVSLAAIGDLSTVPYIDQLN